MKNVCTFVSGDDDWPMTMDVFTDGDFEYGAECGIGSSGCVYKAIHKATGRLVAIKKINGIDMNEVGWENMFCRANNLNSCLDRGPPQLNFGNDGDDQTALQN